MGCDFLFSINELQVPLQDALGNIEAFVVHYDEVLRELEHHTSFFFDTDPSLDELREFLVRCVKEVYACSTRDEGFFYVDNNRLFHITGGTCLGDAPSAVWDSYNVCAALGLTLHKPFLHLVEPAMS